MDAVRQEVRQMLDEYFKAVERRDLNGSLSCFAKGDDLTVFENADMYDWDGFVTFVEGFFQQVTEIAIALEQCVVNPVAETVAVATGIFRVTGRTTSGEGLAIRHGYTFVLLKRVDRWLIKHVHESMV